ncbi:MCE family protein [Euzebya sp.]|uniref:MCE family protein n=1 Tax=Euzebya sp. TaxID=1971409 RepID=UPI0035199E2F
MRRMIAAVVLACALLATACVGPFAEQAEPLTITATFPRTANLFEGSEVRVLGLPVGEITRIEPLGDTVEVEMALDPERDYPADATIRLKPVSLLGERFAQIEPPYTGGPTLEDGAAIPIERTAIPAEVDEVLRSFENFLASLDAGALADLIDVLADTLDGNGQGLNELVDSGAQTVRVLADSSVDLNQVVDDLAALNETLATREERIGSTLTNASTVLQNLQEDRELLVGALTELTRATAELEPLILEHDDPLVRDLATLATTLSTVDRNLSRLGDAFFGAQRLFNTAGRIIDYENARLPLDNEAGPLVEFIQDRFEDRLIGLCLRLDLADCDTLDDILDTLPDLCLPGLCQQGSPGISFAEAAGTALSQLSEESRTAMAAELDANAEAQAAAPAPTPGPLPPVDPRLEGRGSTPPSATPSAGATPSESPTATEPAGVPAIPEPQGNSILGVE